MALLFTESLQLRHSLLHRRSLGPPLLTVAQRAHSARSGKAQLIEIDLETSTSSSSSTSESDSEKFMLKKLDDIVQTIVVQRAIPDWLPFVPGSSFWVPPRRAPLQVADLVGKLADQLTDEESLSVATDRGWPCSQFFIHGSGPGEAREEDMEEEGAAKSEVVEVLEVEVKVLTDSKQPSRVEDD